MPHAAVPALRTAAAARLGLGGAPLGNLFAPVADADGARDARRGVGAAAAAASTPRRTTATACRSVASATRCAARPRSAFVLSSKVGPPADAVGAGAPREQHGYVDGLPFVQRWDYSAAGVRRSVEDSLQRLGWRGWTWPTCTTATPPRTAANAAAVLRQVLDETLPALQALKREGLIGAVGLGVNDVAVVLDVLRHGELDALLLAGRYSLLDHSALPALWPACIARGVHIALGGVFNSGLLATGTRGAGVPRFDYAPAAPAWIERTARIEALCDAHGVPLRAAALQFPLAHPAVEIVMVGARSTAEWDDALAMVQQPIPAAFWGDLRRTGLLPDDAPTP